MEYSLSVSGIKVCYLDTAPREEDGKPILLFFHGWGASKESFAPVVAALEGGYRVIAPDLPGFGGTDEPDRPWDSADHAEFIRAFVEELGLSGRSFSACGHSHGGRILIRWAAGRPAGLRRLILIDSAGLRRKRGPVWYAKVCAYKAAKALLRLPGLGRVLAPLAAKAAALAGSADYRLASPLMRKTMAALLAEDLGPCLPLIAVPTLLFWGDRDVDTPLTMGRRMEREIPGAGLVLLSPAGHYSYLDQFPVFLRALTYFLEH